MVLVDTSVWIDHLRASDSHLVNLLHRYEVCVHPFIIGELACGNLKNRQTILSLLNSLSKAVHAEHDEVMLLIERNALMGKGIGYIDAHLLASAKLGSNTRLWTRDLRLSAIAKSLNIGYQENA